MAAFERYILTGCVNDCPAVQRKVKSTGLFVREARTLNKATIETPIGFVLTFVHLQGFPHGRVSGHGNSFVRSHHHPQFIGEALVCVNTTNARKLQNIKKRKRKMLSLSKMDIALVALLNCLLINVFILKGP